MVRAQLVLLVIAALGVPNPLVSGAGGDGGGDRASLSYYAPQKWEYLLPNETPLGFGSGDAGHFIPVPHKGGEGFLVEEDGAALAVDTNGDGKSDVKVKGIGGNVVLKGHTKAGAPLVYAVRIIKQGAQWQYLPGGMMSGKLLGQDVKLIDLNGNGRYDDFGVDAMIFGGRGVAASYLSKVVSAGGKLHEISVAEDGSSIQVAPWTGESGTLNLASGFKVDGNLSSAVVLNEKENYSFELSANKNGLVVPAGDYKFMYGFVRNGAEQSKIRTGQSKPIAVPPNKTTALTWGTPLEIEFQYTVTKDRLTVPIDIHFFGSLGEEYYDFKPEALSPRIVVFDAETKQKITEGRFGGC